MKSIKSVQWLFERLDSTFLRVIDCRFSLKDSSYGIKAFQENHIPGAVFFDLEQDLSGPVQTHGGRHPLPDLQVLIGKLENNGIGNDEIVVIYDDGEGCFAARCWWLLTYLGHEHVFILDGGLAAWKDHRYPLTREATNKKKAVFIPSIKTDMLASYEEVKQRSQDRKAILIDSRAKERYLGLVEPLDRIAGHIPNALHYDWTDGLEQGHWKSVESQKHRFSKLNADDEVIVYCGSGVSATPNVLTLLESGFEKVKLYAGSYSDWISYPENPVETGE
ncbi:sulfurtransferase [Lederbergia sp. NSJ-179]|uniref:sulfurtransferase n=1 Tax=Lederbergia sp. NSJ-179 TaxID=2931402 RepID=UPI001FD223E7|nr:sulfurtransferase [Lederbergia sp. NSJ-179]MCJ7839507.1 sulfurtransferase [Lederbergia sp. NSJ-179]